MAARYLSISKSHYGSARRRRTMDLPVVTGPVTLSILVLILLAGLSIVYIVQANAVATTGYDLRAQQEKIEELQQAQQALQVKISEAQSLKVLEQNKGNLQLTDAGDIGYLPTSDALARR